MNIYRREYSTPTPHSRGKPRCGIPFICLNLPDCSPLYLPGCGKMYQPVTCSIGSQNHSAALAYPQMSPLSAPAIIAVKL